MIKEGGMKQEVQIIIDYVEGKIDVSEFRKEFFNNPSVKQLLKSKIYIEGYKWCDYNIYDYIIRQIKPLNNNWNNIYSRYVIWGQLVEFLKYFKVPYNTAYDKYRQDYLYLLKIQPSWLDITDDQGLFDKILAERPKELSGTKQTEWGKAVLRKMFRYDKTYPRWVQDPEWPIVNGKPLVFSHQSKEKNGDERVYYYFYDPETKKETVITQIY